MNKRKNMGDKMMEAEETKQFSVSFDGESRADDD